MKVEYINPFVQGAQNIINTVCGETPALGTLGLKQSPYICEPVSITIEIVGEIKGNVVFNMKEEVACHIASKMMFGMPIPSLDDMSKSAISELGNMISGNVATLIAAKGKIIDIRPPVFNMNAPASAYPFVLPDSKLISMPLKFSSGYIFSIDILLYD